LRPVMIMWPRGACPPPPFPRCFHRGFLPLAFAGIVLQMPKRACIIHSYTAMKPGTVVTYFDKDRIISGRFALSARRISSHLLSEHSREINLGLSRVIHSSPAPLKSDPHEISSGIKGPPAGGGSAEAGNQYRRPVEPGPGRASAWTYRISPELVFGDAPHAATNSRKTLRALYGDKITLQIKPGCVHIHSAEQAQKIETKIRRDAERENESHRRKRLAQKKKWAGNTG